MPRARWLIAIATGVSFAHPSTSHAQFRTLRVVSSDSQPVAFANVMIEGGIAQITDERGTITLASGKRQPLTMRVMRIGYSPWFGKVDLADTSKAFIVTLRRVAQDLTSITVTAAGQKDAIKSPLQLAGFYDRWLMRQKGTLSAVFIGPEELEFRHPSRISNMFSGLNGVQVVGGKVYSTVPTGLQARLCPMAILIDGHQQYPPPSLDVYLDANDVMAIEVYARGGNMPISLQANDNLCGVIAIWTGSRKP